MPRTSHQSLFRVPPLRLLSATCVPLSRESRMHILHQAKIVYGLTHLCARDATHRAPHMAGNRAWTPAPSRVTYPHMPQLHLTLELARRIETAEARAAIETAELMDHQRPGTSAAIEHIAGGTAIYCGPDSPVTQAVALGLAGPVTDDDMDRLESFYRTRAETVRVETCPLVDASLITQFRKRGYYATEFSNVFAASLQAHGLPTLFRPALPPNTTIEKVSIDELDL